MNMSFYAAGVGAAAQQNKMDIVANNIANNNTDGYKYKNTVFSDLIYSNINEAEDVETDVKRGSGARVDKTNICYAKGALETTGEPYDFGIKEQGFFAVEDPYTGERKYTSTGNFQVCHMSTGEMYIGDLNANFVIGKDDEPMFIEEYGEPVDPAIFQFERTDRLISNIDSYFTSIDDEEPAMTNWIAEKGVLESSNVNLADQMTKVIESQRVYQYNLRMVQTTDELQQTYNSLR